MSDSNNRGNTKPPKRRGVGAPLYFIAVCVVLVLAMSAFFRVSKIEINGNLKYTEAEITEAGGIETGDNLFFLNTFTVTSRLYAKLPYISEVKVTRSLPNKVVIDVTESILLAYVNYGGIYWAVDGGCKALEQLPYDGLSGLIEVIGIEPDAPVIGNILSGETAEQSKIAYLAEILSGIQKLGIQPDISKIDMGNPSNPTFDYTERFTVKMGSPGDTEYKLNQLLAAAAKLEPGDIGTLDLSKGKEIHFYPG